MEKRAIKTSKPLKMFVYQPVFLKDKYFRSVIEHFPFCRIDIGDVFTTEKRPADYHGLRKQAESKVEAVRYNLAEGACIVILERKTFEKQEDITNYLKNKRSI